jgi:uncharacterized protein YecT (DUF1311 family)
MKRIILLNVLVLIASFSIAQSQAELNEEAKNKYKTADMELNRVYNMIVKEYKSDSTFIKNLKKSQKLWVQFREAEMIVKFPDRQWGYYGNVQPMCWLLYKEELTKERITTLKAWLEGIEEGDVCRVSIKLKTE